VKEFCVFLIVALVASCMSHRHLKKSFIGKNVCNNPHLIVKDLIIDFKISYLH